MSENLILALVVASIFPIGAVGLMALAIIDRWKS